MPSLPLSPGTGSLGPASRYPGRGSYAPEMLTDDDRELLGAPQFAVIATLMPDGSPHTSTVWVDSDGDDVLVNTSEGRVKPANVRRDPRVALPVWDRDDPYRQVIVRGRVVELTHEGAEDHIDELSRRYTGRFPYPWRSEGEQRVILRIRPDAVIRPD
jgi:PPOX class probable F420-dependent enzyme